MREDGSFLMIGRGGGVWISETGISPYRQVTGKSVYPEVEGRFEDPVVWRTHIQYHMVVNDWYGRTAYYLRSKDGISWKAEPGEAYLPGIAKYEDGTEEAWFKYERMKVLQDEFGRAIQAHFAVIDVLKHEDRGSDRHSSKHICIPLTVGRQITILNREKIDTTTATIRIRIAAEEGFNPHTDMDLSTLRFGAPEAVNFGGGAGLMETDASGNDLILTFKGEGNGFTDDNFAAKLLAVKYALEQARSSDRPLLWFEKGRYDFWPQYSEERDYYESNTSDINPKRLAILVEGFEDLVIDGSGSNFVFHDRMQPVTLDHSAHIELRNFTID